MTGETEKVLREPSGLSINQVQEVISAVVFALICGLIEAFKGLQKQDFNLNRSHQDAANFRVVFSTITWGLFSRLRNIH